VKKQIEEFAYGMFSNATEKDSAIIKPMVYSIVQKYFENKNLIDELFKRFDPKKETYISALANILISPSTYEDIAKKMSTRVDQAPIIKNIKIKADQQWLEYTTRLKNMIKDISIEILELKESRKAQSSYAVKEYMQ